MLSDLPRAPLSIKSVDELIHKNYLKSPQKEAIVSYDVDRNEELIIKYKELYGYVLGAANYLKRLGIKRGDRYAILMHNSPEILIFELAGAIVGAATVPLDYKRDLIDRKIFKLKETEAKALFVKKEKTDGKELDENKEIKKAIPKIKIEVWESFEEFKKIVQQNTHALRMLIKLPQISLNETYIVLYTSGTTAHPKGVLLSQRACLLNAAGIFNWQKFTDKDRFNIVLPLHHINSTIFCLSTLLCGGTIILSSRYSGSRFWETVARFGVTNTSIVPTILHDMLAKEKEFRKWKKKMKMKRICIGSAPVLPEETLLFYKKFNIKVIQGYGQTETALRVSGVPVTLEGKDYLEAVKTNTIGEELLNNHLAIMDKDNKRKKENEEGEVCISGPVLSEGYLKDEKATEKAFHKGWFHSGDLGKYKNIKGKKYYYIIGRIKEIIIKGGVNLSPSAIEDVILKNFPEVDQICVIGYPDLRMGEEIAAVAVLKSESKSQEARIKDKILNGEIEGLTDYERPKKVWFWDDLPKTSTGKIQRVEVKRMINESDTGSSLADSPRSFSLSPKLAPLPPRSSGSWGSGTVGSLKSLSSSQKSNSLFSIRRIFPSEKEILEKAAKIEMVRFGLPATYEQFEKRAKNGILMGAFEGEKLVGSLSCLRMTMARLKKIKTWSEATAGGTLVNNDPHGDTLVCVAISVVPANSLRSLNTRVLSRLSLAVSAPSAKLSVRASGSPSRRATRSGLLFQTANFQKYIEEYIESGKDHVISFHQKPKGGLKGAKVWKILENSRPEDLDGMGYNVLMKYPYIKPQTTIKFSKNVSPSILLIETALFWAAEKGIRNVIAFSRPSGFRNYLLQKAA